MEYDNLWSIPSVEKPLEVTENITEIMRQQGKYLKEKTNGKVFCKFSRIRDITAGFEALSAVLINGISENEETKDLEDANKLYKDLRYGFEIYNSIYKFRVFEMKLSPLYPVTTLVDEGIVEDSFQELQNNYIEKGTTSNQFIINNDAELLSFLRIIFSSKKVRYILYRLQLSN